MFVDESRTGDARFTGYVVDLLLILLKHANMTDVRLEYRKLDKNEGGMPQSSDCCLLHVLRGRPYCTKHAMGECVSRWFAGQWYLDWRCWGACQ